jgi:protein phosphatase
MPTVKKAAFSISESGKIRERNEDAFGLFPERGLFLVSDGMGGNRGGPVAARMVVEQLARLIEQRVDPLVADDVEAITIALRDCIVGISGQIHEHGNAHPELEGMGATLVLGYRRTNNLFIANMGDSRAYLFRGGELRQLTEDHSVVGFLVHDGEIAPAETKTHPARGTVLRFMGMEGVVYPEVPTLAIEPGDRLLLCSDGLWGMVSDDAISQILNAQTEPERACRELVDAANTAGGRDNITVLIAGLDG